MGRSQAVRQRPLAPPCVGSIPTAPASQGIIKYHVSIYSKGMINPLISLHAGLGEAGAIALIWVMVELLHPSEAGKRRAAVAAWLAVVALLAAWVSGGWYYVSEYGNAVKPIIKAGPLPWTHSIMMETKEHLFLFLPFLALLVAACIRRVPSYRPVVLLAGLIVVSIFSIAGMGWLVSSGYRAALEVITPV